MVFNIGDSVIVTKTKSRNVSVGDRGSVVFYDSYYNYVTVDFNHGSFRISPNGLKKLKSPYNTGTKTFSSNPYFQAPKPFTASAQQPTVIAFADGINAGIKQNQLNDSNKKLKVGDEIEIMTSYFGSDIAVGEKFTINNLKDYSGEFSFIAKSSVRYGTINQEGLHFKLAAPLKVVSFNSVILPNEKKQSILEAIEQVNNHELIFTQWGFDEVFEKGTAISMLFWGEPGTGKTLMAQAIADKFKKKLKTISTADIESSEPGAAERNIKAFFENTKDDTVLLFDECDSLIYDRTAVGAILAAQVNQLLACLERYKGIVIFTTNRLGVLDEAFNRRLSLKVEFEMPKLKERIEIWKRMFPSKAPIPADMNWERLAGVSISGGYIKNAVLRAARLAASKKLTMITEQVVVDALKQEAKSMLEFQNAKEQNMPRVVGGSGYTKSKSSTSSMQRGKGI